MSFDISIEFDKYLKKNLKYDKNLFQQTIRKANKKCSASETIETIDVLIDECKKKKKTRIIRNLEQLKIKHFLSNNIICIILKILYFYNQEGKDFIEYEVDEYHKLVMEIALMLKDPLLLIKLDKLCKDKFAKAFLKTLLDEKDKYTEEDENEILNRIITILRTDFAVAFADEIGKVATKSALLFTRTNLKSKSKYTTDTDLERYNELLTGSQKLTKKDLNLKKPEFVDKSSVEVRYYQVLMLRLRTLLVYTYSVTLNIVDKTTLVRFYLAMFLYILLDNTEDIIDYFDFVTDDYQIDTPDEIQEHKLNNHIFLSERCLTEISGVQDNSVELTKQIDEYIKDHQDKKELFEKYFGYPKIPTDEDKHYAIYTRLEREKKMRKASRKDFLTKFRQEHQHIANSLPNIYDVDRKKKLSERYIRIASTTHRKL
jgi:hypothetical protein